MIPCPIAATDPWAVLPTANRAVIESLDYFVVENVRSARRFLSSAGIGSIDSLEFAECNEHTTQAEAEAAVKPILEGRNAGVISEAGLPGIADPGASIAALCHRHGIKVVPLTGPSSLFLALMASGLNGQSFAFNGYLPVKPAERAAAIKRLERRAVGEQQSQLMIEAPYRNVKLFADIVACCAPTTMLTVAVDLTAPTEIISTMSVGEWRKQPLPDLNKRPAIFIIGTN